MLIWILGILLGFCALIMMIPTQILGGIILFVLCVWGLLAGPWWVMIICFFLLIGLAMNIFGD